MNIKNIMDRVFFILSVPKCVCCGEKLDYSQKAFCPKCYANFEDLKTRNCSHCSKILSKCSCSNEYLRGHFIKKVIKCFRYRVDSESNPGNSLIYSLKRDNRKDVLSVCADELTKAINNSIDDPKKYIITNVPRRKAAIVEFGIDHSELLAREIANRLGAKYISFLASKNRKEQKSLSREERLQNVKLEVKLDMDLTGKSVIIVDDIITSGASIGSCAAFLRSMGCKDIVAASLGIAYKDS